MNKITQELIAEKEILSDPARWLKGELSADANGQCVEPESPNAKCWCQLGASYKLNSSIDTQCFKSDVAKELDYPSAIEFNDSAMTTHQNLMDFYDACIGISKI